MNNRLQSLDILRGLTLFMLVFFGPVVSHLLSYGLRQYLGDFYEVWITFGNFAIVYIILYIMYRSRVYLRV